MKTIILTVALIAIAVILLGINALFRPHKGFPSGHSHELADIPRRQRQLRRRREKINK